VHPQVRPIVWRMLCGYVTPFPFSHDAIMVERKRIYLQYLKEWRLRGQERDRLLMDQISSDLMEFAAKVPPFSQKPILEVSLSFLLFSPLLDVG